MHVLNDNIEAAKQAFIEADSFALAADDLYFAQIARCQHASLYAVQGKLHNALQEYQLAVQLTLADRGQVQDMGLARVGVGGIQLEWNNLELADQYIVEGIRQGEKAGNEGMLLFGYVVLAQLRQAQGDGTCAHDLLQKVESLMNKHAYPAMITAIAAATWANACLSQGDIAAAERWASKQQLTIQNDFTQLDVLQYITLARLLYMRNQLDDAEVLLLRLQKTLEEFEYFGLLINVLILQALLLRVRGKTVQAITTLADALALAEPEGYIRTFVDTGPLMTELLILLFKAQQKGRLASHSITPGYVKRLLAACKPAEKPQEASTAIEMERTPADTSYNITQVQTLIFPLSEREQEVLRLIATGLSNQQITQKLVVEMNTLKSHIKHLYRKLEVRSRTQAILRAKELKLL